MRIEHINNEFGDISTAVVYKFHRFFPIYRNREGTVRYNIDKDWVKSIVEEQYKYELPRVFYQGGLKKFDDIDFAEYDFRYVLENQKFNNRSLLSYLDSESRNMVGKNRGNLNQINSLIFPTTGKDSDSGFEYFNSLLISTTSAYLFSLNPEEYRIELFEDTLESGNYKDPDSGWVFRSFDYIQALSSVFSMEAEYTRGSVVISGTEYYIAQDNVSGVNPESDKSGVWEKIIKPDTIILLGPDAYSNKNRVDYYKDENMVNGLERESETVENQVHLEDEIYSGKVVWLAISPTNNVKELNLSYAAWLNSEDANRYKNKFNLRNDEYYGNSFSVVKKDEDIEVYRDVRSGRILGTEVNDRCPILKKKLRRLVPGEYNPEVEYPVNSVVTYEGVQFTAIMKNNRGHFPNMSPHWVLSEKLTDYYTKRLTILPDPIDGGYTIPGKQITLMNPDKANLSCRFQVIESLGYILGGLAWENNQGSKEELVVNEDYTITDYSTPETIYRYVEVNRNGLDKILQEDSRKRIIFNFSSIASNLNLEECYVNGSRKFVLDLPSTQDSGQYVYLHQLKVNDVIYTGEEKKAKVLEGFNIRDKIEYSLYLIDLDRLGVESGTTPYRFEDCTLTTTMRGINTVHEIETSNPENIDEVIIGDSFIKNVPCIIAESEVDYTTSSFGIKLTNTRKVIVSLFDGFEVSSTIINTSYNDSNPVNIYFYGTYRDCLDSVIVNGFSIKDLNVVYEDEIDGASARLVTDGKSSIGATKYNLQLWNITKDIAIQLIANTE